MNWGIREKKKDIFVDILLFFWSKDVTISVKNSIPLAIYFIFSYDRCPSLNISKMLARRTTMLGYFRWVFVGHFSFLAFSDIINWVTELDPFMTDLYSDKLLYIFFALNIEGKNKTMRCSTVPCLKWIL